MWAIRNKRTHKWMYGTWWQDGRVVQRTSEEAARLYETYESAEHDFRMRKCGKSYEIVPVRLEVLGGW